MRSPIRLRQPGLTGLVKATVCLLFPFLIVAAEAGPRLLQIAEHESSLSEFARVLIGHWRKTTIVFGSARDEHLVLKADGTAENWVVTASDRSAAVEGEWTVAGKTLSLKLEGEEERSAPFTIHDGQLVFPNIPNRRKFWERLN